MGRRWTGLLGMALIVMGLLTALLVTALLVTALPGCGGRSVGTMRGDGAVEQDGALWRDGAAGQDGTVWTDGGPGMDGGLWPDAGYGPCACAEDEPAYQYNSCVPPLQTYCEAVVCRPGADDCPEGYTCDPCGAAACCHCAACVPACVFTGPAMGPLPGLLKIHPVMGPAGQEQTISIQGFPFYVGALYYLVRLGDSEELYSWGGEICSTEVTLPARGPGMAPVWVSQYGGNEPWVLAGFFTWSSGEHPGCMQPGYPCYPDAPCCETADAPMVCSGGRCRRP